MADLFTVDFNQLGNNARYTAIDDFARALPTEGGRHDFKRIWNDETLKDVAAFANTFGGLLIIGVEKGQKGVQASLIGVESDTELTTRIASSIATNISPNPSYDIAECHKPGEPNRRFCVVRVRSDGLLHLVTKKDISNPAWFRNVDETIPAKAPQLRMMIDRERETVSNDDAESAVARAAKLFEIMRITRGGAATSNSYLKLALLPVEKRVIPLDLRSDSQFVYHIHSNYDGIQSTVIQDMASYRMERNHDSFEFRWHHLTSDWEGRWRVTDGLEIAHAMQIEAGGKWSLVDVVMYVIILLKIGAEWWESLGYLGDGLLIAQLSIQKLTNMGEQQLDLARGSAHQFTSLFGPRGASIGMNSDVLDENVERSFAGSSVRVNFANMRDDIPEVVTNLMNTLLRGLGHGIFTDKFKDNVAVIARYAQR